MIYDYNIENLKKYSGDNFFLIAGPCVIESEELVFHVAEKIIDITNRLSIPYIFKASYRKANRSKADSFKGIGDEKGLSILQKLKEEFKVPVLTDIHTPAEASLAASYKVDVLQIPAFLCRQTDLLEAAASTGKVVNIKKGQFLAPISMKYAAEKVSNAGNNKIIFTERGTQFGYSDLIVDFRSIPEMKSFGYPVVLDVTHSLQQPNQASGVTGGRPELITTMAQAGIAAGVDGIFIETHPEPSLALSDGANMLRLDLLENLLQSLLKLRKVYNEIK
ncbi:MAG TPA: 3-deoxy-8-phosphooctulonate synthase [Bacteroidales bacterium]|jgi:2-dehydro-3-deoxyphosphooctonate aldolase (KDO 8-P synthase)|nr:3-deoxy-8-phosphooctulonate synthase [Bacteroidales bacterium]HRR49551.1 3-deoxy-8-phosphooctulonate synthase [Bacteroidales bacterium]HRT34240.1 3-deoxy-8-phosphooctulonate synthase [Bacteroidales bacterium]